MVILHLVLGRSIDFFHLDIEQNFPTAYQGAKLIVTSAIVFTHLYLLYFINGKFKLKASLIWLPFYVMFLFLGIDELSQFHESFSTKIVASGSEPIADYVSFFDRFDFTSATWLILYIPVFLVFISYVYLFAKLLLRHHRKEVVYLIIGSAMFLFVPVLEYVNTSREFWGTDMYENLMIAEETFEMMGTTFLLYFNWLMLQKVPKQVGAHPLEL